MNTRYGSGGRCANSSGVAYRGRKVDIRLPGKGNSNSHGARPVYQNHLED